MKSKKPRALFLTKDLLLELLLKGEFVNDKQLCAEPSIKQQTFHVKINKVDYLVDVIKHKNQILGDTFILVPARRLKTYTYSWVKESSD